MAQKNNNPRSELARKLKAARLNKKISKSKMAKQLNVPLATVSDIESASGGSLTDVSLHGFARRYAKIVDLSLNDIADELNAIKPRPQSKTRNKKTKKSSKVFVASRATYALAAGAVLLVFLSYASWQIWQLAAAPKLDIYTPTEQAITENESIEVAGKSSPDASVLINGGSVNLSDDGNFKVEVYLQPGQNFIHIQALNSFGREAIETRRIIYSP